MGEEARPIQKEPFPAEALPAEASGNPAGGFFPQTEGREDPGRIKPAILEETLAEKEALLKQYEAHARQAQKLEALGQLTAGIAHDFNNLLAAIKGHAGAALRTLPSSAPGFGDLEEILRTTGRGTGLVKQLLAFLQNNSLPEQPVDLNLVIIELKNMLARLLGTGVALNLELSPVPLSLKLDRGKLEQVLVNLVINARDALPGKGEITITTGKAAPPAEPESNAGENPKSFALVAVRDNGQGIDPAVLPFIFDPFFSTKEPGAGTGLGLSTVKQILNSWGGVIRVKSEPEKGSLFQIYLPLFEKTGNKPEFWESPGLVTNGNEAILLVMEEQGARNVAAKTLKRAGYRVLEAKTSPEILNLARATFNPPGLVIIGLGHSQLAEILRIFREFQPGVPLLYINTSPPASPPAETSGSEKSSLIHYPFTPRALLTQIRRVLDGPDIPFTNFK